MPTGRASARCSGPASRQVAIRSQGDSPTRLALATPAVTQTAIDLMGVTLYWGNTRFKMNYMAFSQLDAYARAWQLYQTRPVIFSRMGGLNIYLAPVPDQAYVTDWDVAILPPPMVNSTDVEIIPPPFTDPVQYWAAFRAKFKEQAMGECKIFKDEYARQGLAAQRAFQTRVLPNPYSR